jgi:hypothetical protein
MVVKWKVKGNVGMESEGSRKEVVTRTCAAMDHYRRGVRSFCFTPRVKDVS